MKQESATILLPGGARTAASGWRFAAALCAGLLAWLLFWYFGTAASIEAIWSRSETFAHGYLIVPISAWLIWRRRREIAAITPQPALWGLALLAVLGAGWLLAALGGVQVVQQLALTAMVPATVLTLLGWHVTRELAFPLGFLLLAVPMGEELIPPLMNFTADFTVLALQITGIPVFREGIFFTIPSGQWSVVEGCSGLRYLIASITVGVLYAYLTYRSTLRRLLFVAASVAVPIVANGFRAYMIVMIAHLSDMKLALGIDHYIYGWVFFGLVMLLLFWVGSYWREDQPAAAPNAADTVAPVAVPIRRLIIAAAAVAGVTVIWPVYADYLEGKAVGASSPALVSVASAGGWQVSDEALTDWRPRYKGADASLFQVYRKGDSRVALYLGYYRHQRQDAELVNSQNIMIVQKHPVWSNKGESRPVQQIGSDQVPVRQTRLVSAGQRLMTWDWYYLDGRHMRSDSMAKLLLASDRLLQSGDDAAAIVVATPYEEREDAARQVLADFIRDMLPGIEAALQQAGR